MGYTATLLPNGLVLVAGGFYFSPTSGVCLTSAELYDPATGTWSTTGPLNTARYYHTATLLPNGQVLVGAGVTFGPGGGTIDLDSAELYDPATGTWTGTASLNTARNSHTATLLPNGQVLVVGGPMMEPSYSVELYDLASETWTPIGSLNEGRDTHTATLLPNGKVLVAAGQGWGGRRNSAELYDPGLGFAGAWRPQVSSLTANLLSGSQLQLTGSRFRGVSEAAGGTCNHSPTNYPLVQLRRLDNERLVWLFPDPAHPFSATSFVSRPLMGLPNGHYLATVFANAIPSPSGIIRFGEAPNPPKRGTAAIMMLLLENVANPPPPPPPLPK